MWHIEIMKRESTFNFRLPTTLKKRLDHFCAQRGISKADVAVAALKEFLEHIELLDRPNLYNRVYPVHDNIESLRVAEKLQQTKKPRRKA